MTFKGYLLDEDEQLVECIETNKMNDAIDWFKGSYEKERGCEPSPHEIKSFYSYEDVIYEYSKPINVFPPKEEMGKFIWRLC